MGDFVELLFHLPYEAGPEFLAEVKKELLREFRRLDASDAVLEQVSIELRQAPAVGHFAAIAKLTGPALVISELRKMTLSKVKVKGQQATQLTLGQRIIGLLPSDIDKSPMKIVFGGLAKKPPAPFMTAIADIAKENIIADVVDAAKETFNEVNLRLQDPSDLQNDPLGADSIAYIVKWCSEDTSPTIYQECTQRAYQPDRFKVLPFKQFYWGLVHAIAKLPPYEGAVVNRGVRVPEGFDMMAKHPEGREIVWWGPTSTTKRITDAQGFLGSDGEEAVIFQIELTQNQARDISKYNPAGEQEVLLPPGCKFKVKGTVERQGTFIISVVEIPSPHLILNLAPAMQVREQASPVSPPTQVLEQTHPVSPPTQVLEQPHPVSPPTQVPVEAKSPLQPHPVPVSPLENVLSNDAHAGNLWARITVKQKLCIALLAVLVIVIIVVVGILKFKVSGGFSCTSEQLLNHCKTCSAADKCECKYGFHNPPHNQSTCLVDGSCSDQQLQAGCMAGYCITGKCDCSEGYRNPAKDGTTCEKERNCTEQQLDDHCEQGKCVSDTCVCVTMFGHIEGKPFACEPRGSPCTHAQIAAGCAQGFCPNQSYCGCPAGFHHVPGPDFCAPDTHMHKLHEIEPAVVT